MAEAGFIFWGLFLVFGMIVAGYLAWMWRVERREGRGPSPGRPPEGAP